LANRNSNHKKKKKVSIEEIENALKQWFELKDHCCAKKPIKFNNYGNEPEKYYENNCNII